MNRLISRETEETNLAERASHHWDPKPIPRERGMAYVYSFLLIIHTLIFYFYNHISIVHINLRIQI